MAYQAQGLLRIRHSERQNACQRPAGRDRSVAQKIILSHFFGRDRYVNYFIKLDTSMKTASEFTDMLRKETVEARVINSTTPANAAFSFVFFSW